MKAIVEYPNGLRRTFSTANKACSLLKTNFNDELWISIDGNGYVNSVTLSTSGIESNDCSMADYSSLAVEKFNTEVLVKHSEIAPFPDTASFVQKIEREREARDRGEVRDNRGFLAKYVSIYLLLISDIETKSLLLIVDLHCSRRHSAINFRCCKSRTTEMIFKKLLYAYVHEKNAK